MKVFKSTNHSKITGNFGEFLTLYLLSRYGFECAHVDHTGIDIIARHPDSTLRLGISVKSRSRNPGTERTGLIINAKDFLKAYAACKAFDCEPYFSIVVDRSDAVHLYILSAEQLRGLSGTQTGRAYWRMTESAMQAYESDAQIAKFIMKGSVNWGALDIKSFARKSRHTQQV